MAWSGARLWWTGRRRTLTIIAPQESTAVLSPPPRRLNLRAHNFRRNHDKKAQTMALGFVHLHLHSAYSLLEGALPIARLAELAKADRQAAVALTDTNNMFGALEFSDKMAAAGIQPIVGCALVVDFADQDAAPRASGLAGAGQPLPRLVLLAATETGYRNLLHLNSR